MSVDVCILGHATPWVGYIEDGVGWGDIKFFACGDMVDATQWCCWWLCIHGRCYPVGRVWDDITCFACGHMVDATQL